MDAKLTFWTIIVNTSSFRFIIELGHILLCENWKSIYLRTTTNNTLTTKSIYFCSSKNKTFGIMLSTGHHVVKWQPWCHSRIKNIKNVKYLHSSIGILKDSGPLGWTVDSVRHHSLQVLCWRFSKEQELEALSRKDLQERSGEGPGQAAS